MTIQSGDKVNLYIFTTSDTPDLYINVIGYCISRYNIERAYFIDIFKDPGQRSRIEKRLRDIRERVALQLSKLKNDEYMYYDKKQELWFTRPYQIDDIDKERYARIARQNIETYAILYESLDKEIQRFIDSGNAIFDVSGALKAFLVDIYTILAVKNYPHVYTFELRRPKRTYDEEELIHNLSLDNGDYVYDNLTDSDYTRNTVVATSVLQLQLPLINTVIEKAAADFAKFILSLYFILVVLTVIGAAALIQQFGWDSIEPWTFIAASFVPYLANIVFLLVWERRFSINPNELYNSIKGYKAKQLLAATGEQRSLITKDLQS